MTGIEAGKRNYIFPSAVFIDSISIMGGISFYCGTYKRHGKGYCTPHTLPFHVLEEIILNGLRTIIQNVNDIQRLVENQSMKITKPLKHVWLNGANSNKYVREDKLSI